MFGLCVSSSGTGSRPTTPFEDNAESDSEQDGRHDAMSMSGDEDDKEQDEYDENYKAWARDMKAQLRWNDPHNRDKFQCKTAYEMQIAASVKEKMYFETQTEFERAEKRLALHGKGSPAQARREIKNAKLTQMWSVHDILGRVPYQREDRNLFRTGDRFVCRTGDFNSSRYSEKNRRTQPLASQPFPIMPGAKRI